MQNLGHWKHFIPIFITYKTRSLSFSPASVPMTSFHPGVGANKHDLENTVPNSPLGATTRVFRYSLLSDKYISLGRIVPQSLSASSSLRHFREAIADRILHFLMKSCSAWCVCCYIAIIFVTLPFTTAPFNSYP